MANTETEIYDRICRTRKAGRATGIDYIRAIFTDFIELHGDRNCADDQAVIGGICFLKEIPVTVIAVEKGHDLNERIQRGFGCARPEGFRKANRLMKEAEKFNRPIICFVDTQGASCGKEAEMRGTGSAIAQNLYDMSALKVPVITVMIGEGGSGGAIAFSVANQVWMLENAYYSVISPESCASILFKDPSRAPEAAACLKLSADDLLEMEIIEHIVTEPEDFTDPAQTEAFMTRLGKDLRNALLGMKKKSEEELIAERYEKFRKIGRYDLYQSEYMNLGEQKKDGTLSFRKWWKKHA